MEPNPTTSFIDRDDILKEIAAEFAAHNPANPKRKSALKQALQGPADRLSALEADGHTLECSEQILLETNWLINYSDDWSRAEQRLRDLEASLLTIDQPEASQGSDGSWGGCCTEWYRKLEPTVNALQVPDLPVEKLRPLDFMAQLQDAKWTLDYLYRLQTSDIKITGRNNRDELGAVQTALSQLIFKDELRDLLGRHRELGFAISAELEDVYVDYLEQTQHPRTGYWDPWYRFGERLFMVQDLSFTFHVVQYRSGNISNWQQVIDSTLAIKELRYPAGWQTGGPERFNNHNNYDVVTLLSFGWPHMSRRQKERCRVEIQALLEWCLTQSVDDDGFKTAGDSLRDSFYFGVRFLDRVGYWDPAKRFWSRGALKLPPGAPRPADLCRRLQQGFKRVKGDSDEASTVRSVLTAARCLTEPDGPAV